MKKGRITKLILGVFVFLAAAAFRPASAAPADCKTVLPNGLCPITRVANPTYCSDGKRCCETAADCSAPATGGTVPNTGAVVSSLCDYISGSEKTKCEACVKNNGSTWTAFGCISGEPGQAVGKFLNIGIGIAGGIAFLLILFGGFQILTSAGNPEQLSAGKELVGSAIAGLLLIIFSVFILRVIGADILGIPKFG